MFWLRAILLIVPCVALSYDSPDDGIFYIQAEVPSHPLYVKEDYSKPVPEMVKEYGYGCESHHVTTPDGYINTLHRIVRHEGVKPNGKVAFLQHGLLGTSADYIMGAPAKSLGYFLSDKGFDVWLGNARGNIYSRNHTKYIDPNGNPTTDYWKFSWDEMGKFDIPTAVNYILGHTKVEQIHYVGHSMGTTMFWVAMNEDPTLSKKIAVMAGMGPVAKVKHMKSPIRYLAPFVFEAELLFHWLGINEFEPTNNITEKFVELACDKAMIELKVCENMCFLLTGFDATQMNMTMLPYILGHEPGGTSTRTVIHYAQLINNGRFCKYDHGILGNLKTYGTPRPPSYDLKKVTVPVALLWSDNDWLADPKDVSFLTDGLPNLVLNYHVPYPKFNHVDFLWAIDDDKYILPQIENVFNKY